MNEAITSPEVAELLLLQRTAQIINSVLDLDLLQEQIVTDVEKTFGYCRSAVLLKDDATNELVITHGWTGDHKRVGDRFEIERSGIAGYVGETEQTHYTSNLLVDPYYEIGPTRRAWQSQDHAGRQGYNPNYRMRKFIDSASLNSGEADVQTNHYDYRRRPRGAAGNRARPQAAVYRALPRSQS